MERLNFKKFPRGPGVYLFKDAQGKVLYVGKAKNLKNRLRSYFLDSRLAGKQVSRLEALKTRALLAKVRKVDFMVTDSEIEALILENELIKQHRPPFNVVLRDDKSYQYIRIGLEEEFPTITIVRQYHISKLKGRTGAKYFGPYTSAGTVKNTLKLINSIFPICNKAYELNSARRQDVKAPCLNWHLGRCLGPCVGKVSSREYREIVGRVAKFLSGDSSRVIDYLTQRMKSLSAAKRFEGAAKVRDQIQSLQIVLAKQKVARPGSLGKQDFLGFLIERDKLIASRSKVRDGRLVDQQIFVLDAPLDQSEPELVARSIRSIYETVFEDWPREILVHIIPTDPQLLEQWLSQKAARKVRIKVPLRGIKKELLLLAQKNAARHSSSLLDIDEKLNIKKALRALAKVLKLGKPLERMEAYDISHLGGTYTVGSMVVFVSGKPNKSGYRRFRIRTIKERDDYAALGEVIARRLSRQRKRDKRFAVDLPEVILIDGGKGQLSAALKRVLDIDKKRICFIALAKREEEIFMPDRRQPVILPKNSPELQLLQRLRDEAHRFALSYQTSLRTRQIKSSIGEVPGIGAATRRRLVKAFGSLASAREASLEELTRAIGSKKAISLKRYL